MELVLGRQNGKKTGERCQYQRLSPRGTLACRLPKSSTRSLKPTRSPATHTPDGLLTGLSTGLSTVFLTVDRLFGIVSFLRWKRAALPGKQDVRRTMVYCIGGSTGGNVLVGCITLYYGDSAGIGRYALFLEFCESFLFFDSEKCH